MAHFHAVVWLDHREAHVMHFTSEEVEQSAIHAKEPHKLHSKHTLHELRHPDSTYLRDVVEALQGAHEILVAGPGSAKLELIKYIHQHALALVPALVGVETVDHPTDGQLLAHARKYFRAADRMR